MTGKFEKVGTGDQTLYGPRKLLLCGFRAEDQPKFRMVLKVAGLEELPLVWIPEGGAGTLLAELSALPGGSGEGVSSELPRAIVMGGITEKEMHLLMNTCRQAGMRSPLWAVMTRTSEKWSMAFLLEELSAERKAIQRKNG